MKIIQAGMPNNSRRCFRIAYFHGNRARRPPLPHELRDGDAAIYVQDKLKAQGYVYAGPILNYPVKDPPVTPVTVDDTFLRPDDLLLLTTRPPLHDVADGDRRRIYRSYTTFEAKILACVSQFLPHCSRSKVTVADSYARAFPEVGKLQTVQFRQNNGAAIEQYLSNTSGKWQRPETDGNRTLAYLFYAEHVWPDGPALLASFGMCGVDTLAWNQYLSTRHPELLVPTSFAMAQLIKPEPAKGITQPFIADFAKDWQIRLMTNGAPV